MNASSTNLANAKQIQAVHNVLSREHFFQKQCHTRDQTVIFPTGSAMEFSKFVVEVANALVRQGTNPLVAGRQAILRAASARAAEPSPLVQVAAVVDLLTDLKARLANMETARNDARKHLHNLDRLVKRLEAAIRAVEAFDKKSVLLEREQARPKTESGGGRHH